MAARHFLPAGKTTRGGRAGRRHAPGKGIVPHGGAGAFLLCALLTVLTLFPGRPEAAEETAPHTVINLSGARAQGYTGKGITVGVIDTPINAEHPALSGKVTEFPPNYGFWGPPSEIDWSLTDHGSHVAGIIAATPSAGNMEGVAYDADIWSGVWTLPGHLYFDLLDGESYLAARPDVKIYNCSWSSTYWNRNILLPSDTGIENFTTDSLRNALYRSSLNTGTLFVFAAGNDGAAIPSQEAIFPRFAGAGNLPAWLSVGSLDAAGIRYDDTGRMVLDTTAVSTFTNFARGAELWTVMAPGSTILSVDAEGGYKYMSGTSMAAPMVSGAAALVQQAFPWFTGKQIADAILTTANNAFQAPEYALTLDISVSGNRILISYIDKDAPALSKEDVRALVISHYEASKASWENRKVTLDFLLGLVDQGKFATETLSREEAFGQGILDVGKAVNGIARLDANRLTARNIEALDELRAGRKDALEVFDTQGYLAEFSNDISQRQWDDKYHHPDYQTGGIKGEDADALADKDIGLRKTGDGMLILSGTNSYRGATVVDGGILGIARRADGTGGELQYSDVLVRNGGTLIGDGVIRQQLVNNGLVMPGLAGGDTLTVHDYVQNADGTLVISFDEQAHNSLRVDTAKLAGTLLLMPEQGKFYRNSFRLAFESLIQTSTDAGNGASALLLADAGAANDNRPGASANGGISGNFETVRAEDISPTLHIALEQYNAAHFSGTVLVRRTPEAYSRFADGAGASSVGKALYELAGVADGDMQQLISALDWSQPDGGEVRRALGQLGPDVYDAAARATLEQQREFNTLLLRRMLARNDTRRHATRARATTGGGTDWQAWAMPYGSGARQSGGGDAVAWDSKGVGLVAGMDRQISDDLSLGFHIALAARRTTVRDTQEATADTRLALLGAQALYAPAAWDGAYLAGQARLGVEDGDVTREVAFHTYARQNESHWTGLTGSLLFGGGKDWTWGTDENRFTAGPLAWLEYAFVRRPEINETQGQASRLHLDPRYYESLSFSLGAHVDYQMPITEDVSLGLDLLTAWRHDLLDGTFHTQAAFRGYEQQDFRSTTDMPGRDALLLQGGIRLKHSNGVFTQLDAGGEFFRNDASSVNIGLSVGWTF